MRHILTLLLLFGLNLPIAFAADAMVKPASTPVSGKIDWVFDYAKGQALSRSSGKPMFVVFRCER